MGRLNLIMKKAMISIDLASMAGTLKFVQGPQLPRHDKKLLERVIAKTFLTHLSQQDGSTVSDIQSNLTDPPDVIFKFNGQLRGIELSEIIPENRFEKDSIIRKLRRDIISLLTISEKTSGFVFNIFLVDDYSAKIRPGHIDRALANALTSFFNRGDSDAKIIEVPKEIKDVVSRISVFRADITGDPRLEDDHEPLIVFGAQNTMLVPEDDCPSMIESRLSRKGFHDLDFPTWLLLWSNHYALASLRDKLDNAISCYLRSHTMNYERIFHLHLFPYSGATEFQNWSLVYG